MDKKKKNHLSEMSASAYGGGERERAKYDALGSYTGTPADGSMPVQDADDL